MNKQQREELLDTLELDRNGDLDPDFKRYWWDVENLCAYADQLEARLAATEQPPAEVAAAPQDEASAQEEAPGE